MKPLPKSQKLDVCIDITHVSLHESVNTVKVFIWNVKTCVNYVPANSFFMIVEVLFCQNLAVLQKPAM